MSKNSPVCFGNSKAYQYHRNAMKIIYFNVRGNFASIH